MSRYWTDKYCFHAARVSTTYLTALTLQFVIVTQAIIFLLVNYSRGLEPKTSIFPSLQFVVFHAK